MFCRFSSCKRNNNCMDKLNKSTMFNLKLYAFTSKAATKLINTALGFRIEKNHI